MQNNSIIYKFYYQWWKNIDKPILFLISILFTIGLFFSLVSTSLIASDKLDTNNYFFFFKHLIYVIIGVIFIFIFSSLNQDKLYKFSIILFFISLTPYFFEFAGTIYLFASVVLGIYYVYLCYMLLVKSNEDKILSKKIFIYSILYLFLIFSIILIDNIV